LKKFTKNNRTLIIFYFLISYVILQFLWWGFHIISLTQKVNDYEGLMSRRIGMVFGEALVFILIIIVGAYYVIRTYYKEMDLAKKEKNFSLSVTHELKTPIASSKLFAQTLLERQDLSYEQQKISLEKIIQEQNRLNDLVEKILLVSSIEEIRSNLNIKPISIGLLINQLIENHNSTHLITNDVPSDIIIQGDDFYMISLIQNLLDNAIKYSDVGSEIIFSTSQNGQELILSVADQGVGIPFPYRTKIFERFYRIEDEEIRSSKGTGLGLFLVNEIVKIHGGKIKCRDNSPKGTVFDIKFKTNYG